MHTILFVDDEPSILSSLSFLFKRTYNVLTAESGPEALKLFKNQESPIHVIVSDQRMPDMLGVELLREVKKISPSTMRILLTGYSDLQSVIASVNTGEVFRYINKPWDNDKLRNAVHQACQFSDRVKQIRESILPNKSALQPNVAKTETHVLFIDPDFVNRQALSSLFQNNYKVHLAGSAREAFAILQKHPIAVITTEANLSDVDGADFLAAVKNMYPSIATILLTDIQDSILAIRLINEGSLFRYLVKPFRRDALKSTMSEAISLHRTADENPEASVKTLEVMEEPPLPINDASMQDTLEAVRKRIQQRSGY
ncbi:response regulator receiver protein [Chloroherpeton thalassium ATCC 35110]|uniref:Response regulator receiver protein n=1 Tax=Chloroherpeton thalassium (strain ATCC 35110 / GB-78) TaxID=517418 RepID=B3QWZ8_CHLT3|nr:response regulator [Chloroherpeton thalassium]ACF13362.1 response regulator receiver protein [Chloroherpeton thalassium ATCC 35110]